MDELEKEITRITARLAELPADALRDDVPLADQGVDSLTALSVVAEIESFCHITVPEEEIAKVQTLRDIFALTHRLMAPLQA